MLQCVMGDSGVLNAYTSSSGMARHESAWLGKMVVLYPSMYLYHMSVKCILIMDPYEQLGQIVVPKMGQCLNG